MQSTFYSCPISIRLEFSRQILEKSSNITFHENPSSGSRGQTDIWTYGHTDRHDETNGPFRNSANAPKNLRGEN
jgi:hypothetical protein